jgi:site-specific DNA-methyltransferase (adenine-specific)
MIIETVLIDDLDLDPRNARKHDAKNLKAIADSLDQFGQRKPIVVWGRTVVAGNGTMAAARSLGWTEISIARVPDDWSSDQVKAYALADNRSAELAVWDEQVLASQLLELTEAEFDVELLGFELPVDELQEVVEDELPEQVEPKAKLGDVWQIGKHKIACGDSSDKSFLSKVLDSNEPDAVITDAPYGISVVQNKTVGGGKLAPVTQYKEVIGDQDTHIASTVFSLVHDLWPSAIQCWWGANHFAFTAKIPNSSCWLVWDKQNTGNFADAELAWTNYKGSVRIFKHMWNGMLRDSEKGKGQRFHPTQKPVALTKWVIETLKINKESLVIDLFAGSGSTLAGVIDSNCIAYGIELDPYYVDKIIARLEKLTGQTAELIEG